MSTVFILVLILCTMLTISNTVLIYLVYKDTIRRITLVTRILAEFISDSSEDGALFHEDSQAEKSAKKVFIAKKSFNSRGTR